MTKYLLVLSLIAFVMNGLALAQTDMPEDVSTVRPAPGRPPALNASTDTGLWLLMQSSGEIAGSRYTMPGQVATLSYQRYLNSFKYPIPRQFNFGTTGASSSGMGSGGTGAGTGSSYSR